MSNLETSVFIPKNGTLESSINSGDSSKVISITSSSFADGKDTQPSISSVALSSESLPEAISKIGVSATSTPMNDDAKKSLVVQPFIASSVITPEKSHQEAKIVTSEVVASPKSHMATPISNPNHLEARNDGVTTKNLTQDVQNNSVAMVEKNSATSVEKITPLPEQKIPPKKTLFSLLPDFPDDRPLTKFEEGFGGKTIPIEHFPWKSRKDDNDEKSCRFPPDTPLSRILNNDEGHTSQTMRKFWDSINDNLSCFNSAFNCLDTNSDNDWVKQRAKELFDNLYSSVESLRQDIIDSVELDVEDAGYTKVLDEEEEEYPSCRREELERQARWMGRLEEGIIVLGKSPIWSDSSDGDILDINALGGYGIEVDILADILQEDVSKVRKMIREVSRRISKDYAFHYGKEIQNSTDRILTSYERKIIFGSRIGFITLEGFFKTLAYAASKM